jgi:hypothetical protein
MQNGLQKPLISYYLLPVRLKAISAGGTAELVKAGHF